MYTVLQPTSWLNQWRETFKMTRDARQVVCMSEESSRSVEQSDRHNQDELQWMTGTG